MRRRSRLGKGSAHAKRSSTRQNQRCFGILNRPGDALGTWDAARHWFRRLGNGQYAVADDLSVRFMWPTRRAPGPQACGSIDNELGTSLPGLETLIVASALCRLLFLALSRVAARIRRAPPGGPRGRALHRRARGLLCFDLPRCTVPMFLMPSVQLPLRLPQRISALFDPPLLFRIHSRPHIPPV